MTAVHHLVRGQTVRAQGGAGNGGTVGWVITGLGTTVNQLRRVAGAVQRVEPLSGRADLVADTAQVTEVVAVAGVRVLKLYVFIGAALGPTRDNI